MCDHLSGFTPFVSWRIHTGCGSTAATTQPNKSIQAQRHHSAGPQRGLPREALRQRPALGKRDPVRMVISSYARSSWVPLQHVSRSQILAGVGLATEAECREMAASGRNSRQNRSCSLPVALLLDQPHAFLRKRALTEMLLLVLLVWS